MARVTELLIHAGHVFTALDGAEAYLDDAWVRV